MSRVYYGTVETRKSEDYPTHPLLSFALWAMCYAQSSKSTSEPSHLLFVTIARDIFTV